MKRAEPRHSLDDLSYHGADAGLHLARRLVGEGHRKNVAGPGTSGGEDVRYARGENARFPGSGAGENEHRSIERLHRKALFRIEGIEIRGVCCCARSRGNPTGFWHGCQRVAWDIAGIGHSRSVIGRLPMPARRSVASNLTLKM